VYIPLKQVIYFFSSSSAFADFHVAHQASKSSLEVGVSLLTTPHSVRQTLDAPVHGLKVSCISLYFFKSHDTIKTTNRMTKTLLPTDGIKQIPMHSLFKEPVRIGIVIQVSLISTGTICKKHPSTWTWSPLSEIDSVSKNIQSFKLYLNII
jgi:hypothetical protein